MNEKRASICGKIKVFKVLTEYYSAAEPLVRCGPGIIKHSVRVGVINNIWLFLPLGTGLYRWFQKKWVLLIPFVMSVAIETTQYITGLGIAEFDDVFGNTMGGWIGILVAKGMLIPDHGKKVREWIDSEYSL